jgi:hypothetical protein
LTNCTFDARALPERRLLAEPLHQRCSGRQPRHGGGFCSARWQKNTVQVAGCKRNMQAGPGKYKKARRRIGGILPPGFFCVRKFSEPLRPGKRDALFFFAPAGRPPSGRMPAFHFCRAAVSFESSAISRAGSIGLAMCPFMPDCRAFSTSLE